MQKHNFSAGPAILPRSVIEQSAQAVLDFNGSGLSILEVSHRGKDIEAVIQEAENRLKTLLRLSDNYHVLFLGGGASTQFFTVPMNLLNEDETAAYFDTGTWAYNAIQEAKTFGNVEVVASSKADNYTHIPKQYSIPDNAKYVHFTSNNTIYGTQFKAFPKTDKPLVCDMSSDFLSYDFDVQPFGLIYAGAQKNLGPAGVTIVIVREDMLGTVRRKLPKMLDYRSHLRKLSSYNTPPVFPIYTCMLTLRWIEQQGGLAAIQQHNERKAALLYAEIDRNPLFKGTVSPEDRSLMNITFVPVNPDHEAPFLDLCKAHGVVGLKGHRSVGGFRASTYNALSYESVEVLVQLMQSFQP